MDNVGTPLEQPRAATLVAIAVSAILGGVLVGASTNTINGAVSPDYFRAVMRWDHIKEIWRAAITQGILEGLVYGFAFSVVFTWVVGRVSGARCSYWFAFRYLLWIIAAIYCFWGVGGAIAMGLAILSPEFFRNSLIGVPDEFGLMVRYAWVGGSIWGAMLGGLLSIVIGCILFSARWRRLNSSSAG